MPVTPFPLTCHTYNALKFDLYSTMLGIALINYNSVVDTKDDLMFMFYRIVA